MPMLKNVSRGPRRIAGKWLEPGEAAEADGRRDWAKHPFVVEGWVEVYSGTAKKKPRGSSGEGSKDEAPKDGEAGTQ